MIKLLKRIVLPGLVACAMLAVVAWVCVRRVVSQCGVQSYEGYFAPVYSPDGQYVYFIERRTTGIARETGPLDFMSLSSPEFNVVVGKDSFSLRRLHVESGRIEELIRFSPSPIEGRRYKVRGSAFQVPAAGLRFTKERHLEFNLCLTVYQEPRAKEYLSSGVWMEAQHTAEISRSWEEKPCAVGAMTNGRYSAPGS